MCETWHLGSKEAPGEQGGTWGARRHLGSKEAPRPSIHFLSLEVQIRLDPYCWVIMSAPHTWFMCVHVYVEHGTYFGPAHACPAVVHRGIGATASCAGGVSHTRVFVTPREGHNVTRNIVIFWHDILACILSHIHYDKFT